MSATSPQANTSIASTSPADVPLEHLPTVELTEADLEYVESIAKDRARSYEDIEGGRVFGDLTSVRAHKVGIVGELAMVKAYGGSLDIDEYDDGDDGFDLTWNGQHTIDVKATRTNSLERPDLLIPPNPEPTADLFFLAHWYERSKVRIIGYSVLSNVLSREPERHPGSSLNYVVPPEGLLLPPQPL